MRQYKLEKINGKEVGMFFTLRSALDRVSREPYVKMKLTTMLIDSNNEWVSDENIPPIMIDGEI